MVIVVVPLVLAVSSASRAQADGIAPPSAAAAAGTPTPPLETVVTAPPEPPRGLREDQAASGSVVIPEESPRAYDDVGSLMLEVPGVTTTRTGSLGSFTTLSLRGSNPDQVRVYIDGVPLNIAEGGAVDISTLPLGDVERVEVYRGQTPLGFGESALGGILSITTRTPGTPRAGARAGMGRFGATFGDLSAGGRLGRVRVYAGAHGLLSRGDFPYLNDMGTTLNPADDQIEPRQNNDVRQADGALRAAIDLPGRRTLTFGTVVFARDHGVPGPGLAQTRSVRFKSARGISTLRYESRDDLGEGGRLSALLFASGQRDAYSDPGELSAGPWRTHDTTLSTGATVNGSRSVAPWLRVAAVAETRAETFQPVNDGEVAMPIGLPARRLTGVGGAEADLLWRWANLDIIPSARVEAMQDVVTGRDPLLQTHRAADPPLTRALPILRLGLVRPVGAHATLKANVGRYARAPSFLELYAGTGRLLGNPALLPESGTNADVALWIEAGERVHVSSRTAVFGAQVQDLIEWQHDPYGHARPDNIAGARVLGVEQEVRVAVGRWGRLTGQATFLDAEDRSGSTAHDGKQLPLRPPWQVYARPELVRLSLPGGGVNVGAFADASLVVGGFSDPANLDALPARVLIGAGVTATVPRWGLRAACSGQNLTGVAYLRDIPTWPLPGRTVFLTLAWQSTSGNPDNQTKNEQRSDGS
jgi:outer membrane receptor protein involved in Fe transport